ncbi:MAG: type III-B CRISPR-associated protein Cas10/Cmr2, partial [Burkholderiaceae bacterium]|nr:type III-B CRISPR-associated protein Cas10/Cmr2 [Burkholderiaceae bacterium]
PRLRGVAQVDLWLRDQMGLPREWFERSAWMRGGTDANPLFSAALPNRFVAVVPAAEARAIAEEAERTVRAWIQAKGREVVDRLLEVAGLPSGNEQYCHRQMREQLEAFPQVHWAAVPFSLIRPRDAARQTDLDVTALNAAMAPFFGAAADQACGFLDSPAWKVLQKEIAWSDDTTFFPPNPGVLYPAVYDLAERVLAAVKAARPFDQLPQRGWRDSLTGEAEWLTTDPAQLGTSPRQRTDTLWARVAAKRPAWARKGEHLGALSALKRLWPALFAEEVGRATGREVGRFVVSTHTMALAHQLDRWLERGGLPAPGFDDECRRQQAEPVALPRRLMQRHGANPALADAKRIPGLLDAAREAEDDAALARAEQLIRRTLASPGREREDIPLETYYGLLMMDGDRMGAILSGDAATAVTFRDSFHPDVRKGFDERAARQEMVRSYGEQRRPISPNRHLAISAALNDFSQVVVRHVVEEEHLGRVIYAGGDDVLAMLPVADLLSAMRRLRQAYSGVDPEHDGGVWRGLTLQNGFAALKSGDDLQVMRMMGHTATASCGAVVAHHQAPLAAVLRELRAAEQRAKSEGGRDAFSITVIKRSGGAAHLTEKWGEPMALLAALIDFLRAEGVSRRAVYNSLEWLEDLPDPSGAPEMLEKLLAYQLGRQAADGAKAAVPTLAARLAKLAADGRADGRRRLADFMRVAEFFAREIRSGADA